MHYSTVLLTVFSGPAEMLKIHRMKFTNESDPVNRSQSKNCNVSMPGLYLLVYEGGIVIF